MMRWQKLSNCKWKSYTFNFI